MRELYANDNVEIISIEEEDINNKKSNNKRIKVGSILRIYDRPILQDDSIICSDVRGYKYIIKKKNVIKTDKEVTEYFTYRYRQ